jgi:MoaA/NifB/PqqE/SkfB family radical SAM enzyme
VGVKLELTYRCNLRCAFCYTDSPRRTLERVADLPDEEWRRIAEEALDLGILEAVLTGGEPLLRRELTLELLERLGGAGVSVMLNTNGWFVDDEVAARIAAVPGTRVHVSVDGATPELHDAARGLRGSWERAVRAVDLLLAHGAWVQVVHVVTPDNERWLPAFLDSMWLLGVRSVRLAPAIAIGAAARSGRWGLDRRALARTVRSTRRRRGSDLEILVQPDDPLPAPGGRLRVPGALLVLPSGAVRIDSQHPFSFGNAREHALEACWAQIRSAWRDPRIVAWAKDPDRVPYLDEDAELGLPAPAPSPATSPARVQELLARQRERAPRQPPDGGDLDGAREHVVGLALARRYGRAPVRWDGVSNEDRLVRVLSTREVHRLNRTAAAVMDACADGTPADAVERLLELHPGADRQALERDVLAAVRLMVARRIVVPAARVPAPTPA